MEFSKPRLPNIYGNLSVMDRNFVYIYNAIFNCLWILFSVRSTSGGSVPFNRSLRYAHRPTVSGGSPFLASFYGRSAPVLLAEGRAVITPDPVYTSTRWMRRECRVS